MTTTFTVTPNLKPESVNTSDDVKANINSLVKVVSEALGTHIPNPRVIVPPKSRYSDETAMNGFLQAAYTAFARHQGLVLSPDAVWLAIAQGFAVHVNMNAERLRDRFVKHEGKKYIEIQRNEFVKGSPDNDWMGGFSEFSNKIAEHVGKTRDLVVSSFSTTGAIEKAASEVVLMDTVKAYFDYGCRTMCGIPEITLLGDSADWANMVHRAMALTEFDAELAPWIRQLTVVLGEFVKASRGNVVQSFWENFFKIGGGSGGPYINGAINVFFPYRKSYAGGNEFAVNKYIVGWETPRFGGLTTSDVPSGLCQVPFRWIYYTENYPMQFLGGFVGAHHDEATNTVQPLIGWAVADREEHASVDDLDPNYTGS